MDESTRPGPPVQLSYTGWTFCILGRFPAPGARCRLRVRPAGVAAIGGETWELRAVYDPVGWLLESGARLGQDLAAVAWRLAE